jgi:hypothetical protein
VTHIACGRQVGRLLRLKGMAFRNDTDVGVMAHLWHIRLRLWTFALVRRVADLPSLFADVRRISVDDFPKLRTRVRFPSPAPIRKSWSGALLVGNSVACIINQGAFMAHLLCHCALTRRFVLLERRHVRQPLRRVELLCRCGLKLLDRRRDNGAKQPVGLGTRRLGEPFVKETCVPGSDLSVRDGADPEMSERP